MGILISWSIVKFFAAVIAVIIGAYVIGFIWRVVKAYRENDFFGDD